MILDNSTKKVSGVYKKWLQKSNLIFPLYENSNKEDIERFIDSNRYDEKTEYKVDFKKLKEEILNG